MPGIRNVLQHRADRFRSKQVEKKKLRQQQRLPLSFANHDGAHFTDQLIKPQIEPDGASSGSVYSLEAKDTHATAVETFSSGEENTAYSDDNYHVDFKVHDRDMNFSDHDRTQLEDGGEFLDLAYEASRQEKSSFRGHEFIDLVQESPTTKRIDVESSNYRSYEKDVDDFIPTNLAQPETIKFVDSEDGKVFNVIQEITKEEAIGHGDLLQNVRSLDDSKTMENDECSQTLNTNIETVQTMPSLNDDDAAQMKFSNRFRDLHVDIGEEGKTYEECDLETTEYENGDFAEEDETFEEYDVLEATAYENGDYDEEASLPQGNTDLYDCDDGEMYIPVAAPEDQQGQIYADQEEDGTFFEQLRTVQSRHVNEYQTHPGHMGIVDEEVHPEQWQSLTKQIYSENPQNLHLNMPNDEPFSPQLEDPYLSDGNSSWGEGSFATGASRAVSRVDTACDGCDDDDDGTYAGTFDGTECYSDDDSFAERNGNRPFVRILKKIRDMNVDEEQSRGESSDEEEEEDYEDKKTRFKKKDKRQLKNKKSSGTFFESIREIGTDILNETIDYAEQQDRSPRRRNSRNQGGTLIDSFTDLFSCGGPSRY